LTAKGWEGDTVSEGSWRRFQEMRRTRVSGESRVAAFYTEGDK
jgi:hypothetical protein